MEDIDLPNVFEYQLALEEQRLMIHNMALRIQQLQQENTSLKTNIQNIAMENSTMAISKKHHMSPESKARWEFYHNNKKQMKKTLNPDASWHQVKKATDMLYTQTRTTE